MESKVLEIVTMAFRIPGVKISVNKEAECFNIYDFNKDNDYAYMFSSYYGATKGAELDGILEGLKSFIGKNGY